MTNSWIPNCYVIICLLVLGIADALSKPPLRPDDVDDIEEFPWNAAIVNANDKGWFPCSATIVSQRHVVTSANCVRHDSSEDMHVTVGSSAFGKGTEYKLKTIYIPQNASDYSYQNDIAVIELDGEIKFDKTRSPIPLPDKDVPVNTIVTLAGWADSQYLKKQDLTITENQVCEDAWAGMLGPDVLPFPGEACVSPIPGSPFCQSNMGTGVVYEKTLVAIALGATPCFDVAVEIFTRVYQHVDWIREVMNE